MAKSFRMSKMRTRRLGSNGRLRIKPNLPQVSSSGARSSPPPNVGNVTSVNITDSSVIGRGILTAADAAAVLTLIGLGTTSDPRFNSLDLGGTTDATITRLGPGLLGIEGVPIVRAVGDRYFEDFGAVGDGVFLTTGVSTDTSTTFTCTSAVWTSADVGKPIVIAGAGVAGATLATTIAARNSNTSIELADAASHTGGSKKFYYGTDDTAAIQSCLNATTNGQSARPAPGKIYMTTGLYLDGGFGTQGFLRKGLKCVGGMATIVAASTGDYLIASKRWRTGDANGTFTESPWELEGLNVDAFGLKENATVVKMYAPHAKFCIFKNGLDANFRFTRQNQDGSTGTTSYQSGGSFQTCLFITDLAGIVTTYGFHNQGEAADQTLASTDATMIDCQSFGNISGASPNMDVGIQLDNSGGWTVHANRTFSCGTGGYIYACSKNHSFKGNNWDCNLGVALRVGSVLNYYGFASFSGDTFYSDLVCEFTNDTSVEMIVVRGCDFWFDPVEPTTGIGGDGYARIVHKNDRATKTIRSIGNTFRGVAPHRRFGSYTLGVFDVYDAHSIADPTHKVRRYHDSGATGVVDRYMHDSGSPAAQDVLLRKLAAGRNSAAIEIDYLYDEDYIVSPTDAAESGGKKITAYVGGALTRRHTLDPTGCWIGAATPSTTLPAAGATGLNMFGTGFADSSVSLGRFSNDNGGVDIGVYKSRGTSFGTHTVVGTNDGILRLIGYGADGTTARAAASIEFRTDGTAGSSDMPGKITLSVTPDGSATLAEALRISQNIAISHRANATIIVDASSHLGLRSYTVGTLPSASTAARLIYVSDGTSNKRLAVSDGTNWRWPDGAVVS